MNINFHISLPVLWQGKIYLSAICWWIWGDSIVSESYLTGPLVSIQTFVVNLKTESSRRHESKKLMRQTFLYTNVVGIRKKGLVEKSSNELKHFIFELHNYIFITNNVLDFLYVFKIHLEYQNWSLFVGYLNFFPLKLVS